MKNYIVINGKKIKLTNEQILEIKKSFNGEMDVLSEISPKETFSVGEYEFVVLEQSGEKTFVLLKKLLRGNEEFGENNNYLESHVDKVCNDFAKTIESFVGENNLIEHTVDLTSDDGLKDYGTIKRKMSLLTAEQYRRYIDVLDNHKIDKWWWLSTPCSTPTHGNNTWVKCVSPHGLMNINGYDSIYGVRPFCILNSNILVSK